MRIIDKITRIYDRRRGDPRAQKNAGDIGGSLRTQSCGEISRGGGSGNHPTEIQNANARQRHFPGGWFGRVAGVQGEAQAEWRAGHRHSVSGNIHGAIEISVFQQGGTELSNGVSQRSGPPQINVAINKKMTSTLV